MIIKKEEAPAIILEIKECATAEQRPVEHNHTNKLDSVTQPEGSISNNTDNGSKRRNILDFFKSLFKQD